MQLSASEPRVCLRRERAAGGPEPVQGFREHVQGACLKAPRPLPKKVRGPSVPWDSRLSRLPLQSPAWPEQATGQLCCWGCPPGPLEAVSASPPGFWGILGRTLESGHRKPWGEAETPEGIPAPLTVTPHTQQ